VTGFDYNAGMTSFSANFMIISRNLALFIVSALLVACEQSSIPISQSRHTAIGTYDADISDDGNFSLVASVNHDAGYWDLRADTLLYNWQHTEGDADIIAVDISPDGSRAITATATEIALWDTSTGKNVGFYKIPDSDLRDVKVSAGGRFLVMGLGDGRVIHLSLNTGRRLEFMMHTETINSIDISPNGRYVLSGSNDFKAIFWDAQTGQPIDQWQHDSRVVLVTLSRDGSYAFTAGNKADAIIWNLADGNEQSRLKLKERQYVLSSARFAPDNLTLLTGAPSRELNLWQTATGKLLQTIRVSTRTRNKPTGAIVYAVAYDADGNFVTESSAGWGERWQFIPPGETKQN
jgi:WD40 repeat protein